MIKTFLNPQPAAVERGNKTTGLAHLPHKTQPMDIDDESTTEIFLNESEEEAWKDAIKKGNPF